MDSKHWHFAVGQVGDGPIVDVIVDNETDVAVTFLDFCQSFFYHDFAELDRIKVEEKMGKYIGSSEEEKAFQMVGSGYAAVCYPCSKCKKESMN